MIIDLDYSDGRLVRVGAVATKGAKYSVSRNAFTDSVSVETDSGKMTVYGDIGTLERLAAEIQTALDEHAIKAVAL